MTQVVQFINETFIPFDPHNNAVYNLEHLATKDIFRTVFLYTDYFDDKNLKSFTAWCSRKTPNPLLAEQDESWCNSNIWVPLIDSFYDNVDGINCVRYVQNEVNHQLRINIEHSYRVGPANASSRKRKRANQERFERRKTCSTPDMSIHLVSGGGNHWNLVYVMQPHIMMGLLARKYYHGSTIMLPKMLKDMFDLCEYVDWDLNKIRQKGVEGYIQSGKYLYKKKSPLILLLIL